MSHGVHLYHDPFIGEPPKCDQCTQLMIAIIQSSPHCLLEETFWWYWMSVCRWAGDNCGRWEVESLVGRCNKTKSLSQATLCTPFWIFQLFSFSLPCLGSTRLSSPWRWAVWLDWLHGSWFQLWFLCTDAPNPLSDLGNQH